MNIINITKNHIFSILIIILQNFKMGCNNSDCIFISDNSRKYEEAQILNPLKPSELDFNKENPSVHVIQPNNGTHNKQNIGAHTPNPNSKKEQVQKLNIINSLNSGYTTFSFDGQQMKGLSHELNLKEGEYSIGQYSFVTDDSNTKNFLGRGGFGKVFKGYSSLKDHPEVAIKVMVINNEETLKLCRQETLRQQLVKSDGIVKIYMSKIIPIQQKRIFVIACELMDKGQLSIPENGYSHQMALHILKSILKCYQQLYKRGMAHRDLKPQNILTNKRGEFKISDFGSAMERTDKKGDTTQLTRQYASPQQSKNHEHTDKCDVYSIGCIFFQLLVGTTPRYAKCTKTFNRMDMDKVKSKLKEKNVPQDMVDFLEGCFKEKQVAVKNDQNGREVIDPSESRMSWEEVYLHPLFKGELSYIAREVAGSSILLSMKTFAESISVNLVNLLKNYTKSQIEEYELFDFLGSNKIQIPYDDIKRLGRMFCKAGSFDRQQLLKSLQRLQDQQFSNYTVQESRAFLQMFDVGECKNKDYNEKTYKNFIDQLKNETYHDIQFLHLWYVNFTSFPLLPPMAKIRNICLQNSQIQTLQVRLNTPQLQFLDICGSQIQKIVGIKGCPNLTHLQLSNNKLTQLQGLQMIPKLKIMNIYANRLYKISNISHLKQLQTLNLSSNRISTIEGVSGCISLKQIDLSSNRIKQFGDQLGKLRKGISRIDLRDNLLTRTQRNYASYNYFVENYPQSQLVLTDDGGTIYSLQDQKFQLAVIPNGMYRIYDFKYLMNSIGIEELINPRIEMCPANMGSSRQKWRINLFQEQEYCIYSQEGYILQSNILEPYKADEGDKQKEQSPIYRWAFHQKGVDSIKRPYYQIFYVPSREKLFRDEQRGIQLCKERKYDNSDLWYILPVK